MPSKVGHKRDNKNHLKNKEKERKEKSPELIRNTGSHTHTKKSKTKKEQTFQPFVTSKRPEPVPKWFPPSISVRGVE